LRYLSLAFAATAFVLVASSCFAADTDSAQPAVPAATAPAAAAPNVAAPETKTALGEDPNAVVCKRLAPETGTRLGSRTQCRTNAEWNEITRQAQEGVRLESQRGSATPSGH
jgi:hypothetical protein